MDDDPRTVELIQRLRAGDESAARQLVDLYAQQLWRLANARLGERLAQRMGASDVVQSAFQSFFRRIQAGEFQLDHRESMWRLLAGIAVNKVRRAAEHHGAQRRRMQAESPVDPDAWEQTARDRGPSPEEAVALADELERLVAPLSEPEPEILGLALAGYSPGQIADQIGCSRWTVRRVLNRMGETLEKRWRELE